MGSNKQRRLAFKICKWTPEDLAKLQRCCTEGGTCRFLIYVCAEHEQTVYGFAITAKNPRTLNVWRQILSAKNEDQKGDFCEDKDQNQYDQAYYEGFGAVLVTGQYTSQGSRTDCMRAQMSRQKKRVLTHHDQATQTESKKPKPPPAFVCSITQEVMQDPVMNECGMTFERDAIERWMRRSKTCPLTNMQLSTFQTIPNMALRHAIEHWMSSSDSGSFATDHVRM